MAHAPSQRELALAITQEDSDHSALSSGHVLLKPLVAAVVKRLDSSHANAVDNTAKASEHEDALSTLQQRVTELRELLQLSSEGRRQDAEQAAEARRAGHERGTSMSHHRTHTCLLCLPACLRSRPPAG
jgi:hypothetical protein